MTYPVNSILELARKEVGYHEKATNSQLDNKTANSGTNNYTKYARDLYAADYYNGNKNGYDWCDVFVDWLFYKCFGKETGQMLQCQTGDLGAGCVYSSNYYKNANQFYHTPKIGDQIFFKDISGTPCHTGIVVAVYETSIQTIEGNTSGGCVAVKSYPLSYSRIYGYGRPKYDLGDGCVVQLPILEKGSKGGYVKTLQILLNKSITANLDEDGSFGPLTREKVVAYQKLKGLTVDGSVGPETWSSLLKGPTK